VPAVNALTAVRIAACALLAACAAPPPPQQADAECHAHRSWFQQRSSIGLHDECVRQFGEDYCRKCLLQ
jgi:hypothetical protein